MIYNTRSQAEHSLEDRSSHIEKLNDFLTGKHVRTLSKQTKETMNVGEALIEFAQYLDWLDTAMESDVRDSQLL